MAKKVVSILPIVILALFGFVFRDLQICRFFITRCYAGRYVHLAGSELGLFCIKRVKRSKLLCRCRAAAAAA